MTIKELKEKLNQLPPESDNYEVILQKDAEGNGYSPLLDMDAECIYVPESTWNGEIYSITYSAEDNCMEEEEWESLKNDKSKRAVVLFPIN